MVGFHGILEGIDRQCAEHKTVQIVLRSDRDAVTV